MLVNLSDVFTTEGKSVEMSVPVEMTEFNGSLGNFPILEKGPAKFTFTNLTKDRVKVNGCAEITFEAKCDRCLDEVPLKLKLSFERDVFSPDASGTDKDEDDDERKVMQEYHLDTENLLYNEISVNWPAKILCRPDCKGLCPVCGRNLNEGECGCDTFVPDPRMAAIQDIFDGKKEV